MLEPTKKPPIDIFKVICPADIAGAMKKYLREHGCQLEVTLSPEEVFPQRSPGTLLQGARYREDLTQAELAKLTGIPRRHISEMENGHRSIGKQTAKRLAQALNIDHRLLLGDIGR
ncbi:MAG: helix-turn-helix transcriptional regulator [Deltaproteobacteria bacterium]|jgi:DNA-binding XRE family transcriptional regulator|nr:helix-turn-helix transcriptional regulator [Deltaproteobacteria bacterium]